MKFYNQKLEGIIKVPMSKTHLHRFFFNALLSQDIVRIKVTKEDIQSEDVLTTLNILKVVGCSIVYDNNILIVDSTKISYNGEQINCNKSGTTLRIVIPIFLYLFGEVNIKMDEQLANRPLDFYQKIFKQFNILWNKEGKDLYIKGEIKSLFKSDIYVKECDSSQYITGLMTILPFINLSCKLIFEDKIESVSYLEVTKQILISFNINYDFEYVNGFLSVIKLNPNYNNDFKALEDLNPQVDYSSVAFWLVANELGANISFENTLYLKEEKFIHPDQYILNIIKEQKSIIDIKDCPDLLPILIVYISFGLKPVKIIKFQRNRIKESNRVEGMIEQFNNIGANVEITSDYIVVNPITSLYGGVVDSLNDHRLAMAFAISSLRLQPNKYIEILNFQAIDKSYPNFFKHYKMLINI